MAQRAEFWCFFSFATQKRRAREETEWVTTTGKAGIENCRFYPLLDLDYFPAESVRKMAYVADGKYCILLLPLAQLLGKMESPSIKQTTRIDAFASPLRHHNCSNSILLQRSVSNSRFRAACELLDLK